MVIDLIFLHINSEKFNNHQISHDLRSLSDHIPLLISIIIKKEFVQEKEQNIVKNVKDEKEFIKELKVQISNINSNNILDSILLEFLTQEFTSIVENL